MPAGLMAWLTKWAVLLVGGALIIIGLVVAWIWHNHTIAVNAAAPAKAQVQVEKAGKESAHAAITTVEDNGKKSNATDDTTRKTNVIILKTPGANVDLSPELDAAGRAALCLYKSTANFPECQQLQHPDPK